MSQRVALIGLGNLLFKDEGVGVYAARYIKENYTFTPFLEIVDGGVLGLEFMAILMEYERVIVCNTFFEAGVSVGKVMVQTQEEFLLKESMSQTVSDFEIAQMLRLCLLMSKTVQTSFVSMAVEDIYTTEIGVSKSTQEHWKRYVCAIIEEIERTTTVKKRKNEFALDAIIGLFRDSKRGSK